VLLARLLLSLILLCFASSLWAEGILPRAQGALFGAAKPLVQVHGGVAAQGGSASLFSGTTGTSLFAPYPERAKRGRLAVPLGGSEADRILSVIAKAEAGRSGYDAVNYGARIKPPKAPSQMTIGEIYKWIRQTPGQPHAIGRYQFIPKTLRRLVNSQGLSTQTRFSPRVQDQLARQLLQEAGLSEFKRGALGRKAFMRNLSKIWAGLPLSNGKSYYQGYAGNKATMSWSDFDRSMQLIFPGRT
jgi:hypothetical protein